MMRILIAGCGDVGSVLGRLLAGDGHQVFGLRRNAHALPDELTPVAADLGDPATLRMLPEAVELLCYTTAAAGFSDDAYRSAYVDGLRNLLQAMDASALRRVVFVSSTGVYGQERGEWVDEDSATEPSGFSGRRLLEGEAVAASSGIEAVSIRFGGIYGPGRNRLIERVREGASCVETPPLWTNRIHRDDCAAVLRHVLYAKAPAPVYVGVDCEPAPQCAVMDWLARRLGVAPPPRAPSAAGARGANKRCSNRRLLDSGYEFIYPSYREGYRTLLDARP